MSINAINNMQNTASVSANKSTQALTEATRLKLETLGIDTSKIKTESEGQLKLKEAQGNQSSQNAQNTQAKQQQNAATQVQQIDNQIKLLASQVGVQIGNNDNLNTVLNNIANRISQLMVEAANEPQKLQQVKLFQDSFTLIISEVANLQEQQEANKKQQSQLTNSMNNMASYNKIFFGL